MSTIFFGLGISGSSVTISEGVGTAAAVADATAVGQQTYVMEPSLRKLIFDRRRRRTNDDVRS